MFRRKKCSVVADDPDEFRRNAERCLRLAAIEASEEDKSYWLRQADHWRKMAVEAERLRNHN